MKCKGDGGMGCFTLLAVIYLLFVFSNKLNDMHNDIKDQAKILRILALKMTNDQPVKKSTAILPEAKPIGSVTLKR